MKGLNENSKDILVSVADEGGWVSWWMRGGGGEVDGRGTGRKKQV